MSTVQDEADPGPQETKAENEERISPIGSQAAQRASYSETEPGQRPLPEARQVEDWDESPITNGKGQRAPGDARLNEEDEGSVDFGPLISPTVERPSSTDGSVSTPDDTPSIQNSIISSPGGSSRLRSPNRTLRPFDRRFKARLSYAPQSSARPLSPAFLTSRSRQSSIVSQILSDGGDADTPDPPWEVVRWTKLRKISSEAFSEAGRRNFGRPTCVAVATTIVLGTSKGVILVFDYHQNLKATIGLGTKAIESGAITAISLSADTTTVAGGHANGSIFTWEIARPAKPFLHIPPITLLQVHTSKQDGHVVDVAVVHVGFLGTRHTALVSADDKGMAFSHLTSRGMGAIARTVHTTRILGRYPEVPPAPVRSKKPSAVLAFSPLPLGNVEAASDNLGLVAMLTPYLLVIVSTTPIAQTQHKASRPKELAAHGAMSAALAWYPTMKTGSNGQTNAKLAYCWLNVLTILEVEEVEPSENSERERPPEFHFKFRKRWQAEESIVALQWISRSVLAVITITQRLLIWEDMTLDVTDSSDLLKKHIYHVDSFSQHLSQLIEKLDEENTTMHGVVADAFHMSFRAYKGRLFILGFNDVSMGTLSNWADRLLALMEQGDFIGAIHLATSYYTGDADRATVGLPEDAISRQSLVREKLLEMMSASLKYAFGKNLEAGTLRVSASQLEDLANACFVACLSIGDVDFLFEEVFSWYSESLAQGVFLRILDDHISDGRISTIPPVVLKDLVNNFVEQGQSTHLEEIICRLSPDTMDLDQVTSLCRKYKLYDALFYVWNQALADYTTILKNLLDTPEEEKDYLTANSQKTPAKFFPYLSYILTGRIYPTGESMSEERARMAKAEVYYLLFSGSSNREGLPSTSFPYLRKLLDVDTSSFMSVLNEAFEDSFLNGLNEMENGTNKTPSMTSEQRFGLSLNRQYVLRILLQVLVAPEYQAEDILYLDMFIARNLPKYPQYILLPGSILHRVFVELCNVPNEEIADDCQLSVEYLLSVYQPPDLPALVPTLSEARFYRVIKSIYTTEKQYALLLRTCFEDTGHPNDIFDCIHDCLGPRSGLNEKQLRDVRAVIEENAYGLLDAGLARAASTLDAHAPELHAIMIARLDHDEQAQFQYLREVLEPTRDGPQANKRRRSSSKMFVEQYVRLLCDYDPRHVSGFVETLKIGDLRLEEVLPAMESSGVIDAAVLLMARDGKVREAIDRLNQHLKTLEAALLGLLQGAEDAPDVANTREAAEDLVESVGKYARIGVWLCQGQARIQDHAGAQNVTTAEGGGSGSGTGGRAVNKSRQRANRRRSQYAPGELTPQELLWLDLVDATVQVTRNVSEVLENVVPAAKAQSSRLTVEPASRISVQSPTRQSSSASYSRERLLARLRTAVQDTFTALLASTSHPEPSANPTSSLLPPSSPLPPTASKPTSSSNSQVPPSFLRILRAFLSRASASSPSLSHLRGVLSTIFTAYAYEEGLLALANRLLDKDLFARVEMLAGRRRRGWRPLGQVCAGCGGRVWGPGAGARAWEAWTKGLAREADEDGERYGRGVGNREDNEMEVTKGKAKAVLEAASSATPDLSRYEPALTRRGSAHADGSGDGDGTPDTLIVFSCRHIFHRRCLDSVQVAGRNSANRQIHHETDEAERLKCPLESEGEDDNVSEDGEMEDCGAEEKRG